MFAESARIARGILLSTFLIATTTAAAVAGPFAATGDAPDKRAADVAAPEPAGEEASHEIPMGGSAEPYYFYHGLPYGSESLTHPLRLIINGGYGILQMDNRDNRIGEVDYRTGWRNLWRNLSDPFSAINHHGWSDFFQREITPISVNSGKAHYWPNYTLHLIGGGMSYRMYVEWFRYNGYSRPKLYSGVTIAVYHLLNEVVENNDYEGWTTDPIADLYIFDPLGMLLFSSDRVSRFFGETLNMRDWSYQPTIDPTNGRLENHGQNFMMKYRPPWFERWSLFYHWGTRGEGGLSYRRDNGESISVGLGLVADNLWDVAEGIKGADLAASGGIFYDRNNSLLASLLMAKKKGYRARLNVYPGWLSVGPASPGFFVAEHREDGFVFGVTLNFLPPVGVAASAR